MPDDTKPQTAVTAARAVVQDVGRFANLMDSARFEHIQRVGTMFANSNLVPEHFRGKQADCVIAVEMALRLDIHPFALMQSLYVVHGKPGIEAKMAIALINSSGLYKAPLAYKLEGEGMKRQCTAYAEDRASGAMCSAVVTMEMAKAEGWIDKAGSKWKTMPDIMLQYRSASFFGRLNCPQVIFGMSTREELEEIDVTPAADPETPRRQTLKERVVGNVIEADREVPTPSTLVHPQSHVVPVADTGPSVADLVASGHIVIHDDKPSQVAAGGAGQGELVPNPHPTPQNATQATGKPPWLPYESALKHAKQAKTQDQVDVVRDAMNGADYSEAQVAEIKSILDSKKLVG